MALLWKNYLYNIVRKRWYVKAPDGTTLSWRRKTPSSSRSCAASSDLCSASWDHLLGNCLVLYVVGMACEHAFGFERTAIVYFTNGLAGSLLSAALSPGPSVGASGAIFGVVAAVVVVLYRHQERFSLRDKRIGFVLLVWAGYQISTGLLNPYIDNYGHLGGLAGGGSTALLLEPSLLSRRSRR